MGKSFAPAHTHWIRFPYGGSVGALSTPQPLWTPQLQLTQTAELIHQERSDAPEGWTTAREKEGSANNFKTCLAIEWAAPEARALSH